MECCLRTLYFWEQIRDGDAGRLSCRSWCSKDKRTVVMKSICTRCFKVWPHTKEGGGLVAESSHWAFYEREDKCSETHLWVLKARWTSWCCRGARAGWVKSSALVITSGSLLCALKLKRYSPVSVKTNRIKHSYIWRSHTVHCDKVEHKYF